HQRAPFAPSGRLYRLPRMPQRRRFRTDRRRRAPSVFAPQPARSEIPEMHRVPRAYSRLQLERVLSEVTAMLNRLCFALTLAGAAAAQQTVAPTDARVGPPRGENTGNYNVTQSFELGYRWRLLGGDQDMYRSVVNYRNGVSLLGSRLTVNSRDGHGGLFDEILLTTQGLGSDPYQSAIL